jgi:hypothetical protein
MADAKSRGLAEACQANHWECVAVCRSATAAVLKWVSFRGLVMHRVGKLVSQWMGT